MRNSEDLVSNFVISSHRTKRQRKGWGYPNQPFFICNSHRKLSS